MKEGISGLSQELRDAQAEVARLRGMLLWAMEQVFEGCDIWGGDFQDEMVKRGLLVNVGRPSEAEMANEEWPPEWEEGDPWYVLAWSEQGQAFLAEQQEAALAEQEAQAGEADRARAESAMDGFGYL